MATVLAPPEELELPDMAAFFGTGRFDSEAYFEAERKYLERLGSMARQVGGDASDLIGEVLRFQIADGYAVYVVWDVLPTLELIHVPLGDAYRLQEFAERGLQESDVREKVQQQQSLDRLFGRSKHAKR